MDSASYKGFEISPAPQQLRDSRQWTLNLYIRKRYPNEIREKNFHAANTFETKAEAEQHCIRFGQQIIDGKSRNCSVEDL